MARTQAIDYDRRREAIMETAAKLYAAKGFLGTSVAQIAVACETSKSLLYHYYPSKEDILFDVMDSHVQALVEAAKRVEEMEISAADKIRRLADDLMAVYVGAQAHQKVLLNELVNLPEDRRRIIIDHQRQLLDIVDRQIIEIRPDLAKHRAERRAMMMLLFGMLNWTHTWYDPAGPVTPARFAALAAESFLKGLRPASS
ncbi:TetR/AcrR family transcriptional regulator [Caulobacter sp. SSI4214]|uniref:TetR/AcrR family transcriptional regulator n=1 Tax=Caulobacter sp. SSI4214 TaxID=2575739 RepID=UPI001439BA0D|nr:TetR/AcrR family transcriptional regulator [Caulobacter sp. SSI4214]